MPLMLPVLVKLQWTAKGPPGELPVILIFVVVLVAFSTLFELVWVDGDGRRCLYRRLGSTGRLRGGSRLVRETMDGLVS